MRSGGPPGNRLRPHAPHVGATPAPALGVGVEQSLLALQATAPTSQQSALEQPLGHSHSLEYNGPRFRGALLHTTAHLALHRSTPCPAVCTTYDASPRAAAPAACLPALQRCEERFAKSKLVHSIMRHVAETSGANLEELYAQIAWPLYRKYGHAYDAFRTMINVRCRGLAWGAAWGRAGVCVPT